MVPRGARSLVAFAALGALCAARLESQSASCDSVFFPRTQDWTQDTLFLAAEGGYGVRPVPDDQAQLALLLLTDSLKVPQPLALPPVAGKLFGLRPENREDRSIHHVSQSLAAEAFVLLTARGEVKEIGLSQTSLVPDVDAALVDALRRAVPAGALKAYADAARGSGGAVFIQLRTLALPKFETRITLKEQIDARNRSALVPEIASARKMTRGGRATFPLRILRVPLVAATSAAAERKRGPSVTFPPGELSRSFDGTVHVEFVIGTNGKLVPGTMRLVDAATYGYAASVLRSLERYEWQPAMAGSCPIAQHMAYTFTFEVR